MAHFAELDENNVVLRVVVIDNNDLLDSDGVEQESLGIAFCQSVSALCGACPVCFQHHYPGCWRGISWVDCTLTHNRGGTCSHRR